MDEDRRELGRRLCVLATEIAETVHDVAVAGQVPSATAKGLQSAATRLSECGNALKATADVLGILARHIEDGK